MLATTDGGPLGGRLTDLAAHLFLTPGRIAARIVFGPEEVERVLLGQLEPQHHVLCGHERPGGTAVAPHGARDFGEVRAGTPQAPIVRLPWDTRCLRRWRC